MQVPLLPISIFTPIQEHHLPQSTNPYDVAQKLLLLTYKSQSQYANVIKARLSGLS